MVLILVHQFVLEFRPRSYRLGWDSDGVWLQVGVSSKHSLDVRPSPMKHHYVLIEGPHVIVMVPLLIMDSRNHFLTSSVEGIMHIGLTLLEHRLHAIHAPLNDFVDILLKSF